MVNLKRTRSQPYELKEFYPYDLPGESLELPSQTHEDIFEQMQQQVNTLKNG